MSYFMKKSWIAVTLIAAAFTVTYACNCNRKPNQGKAAPKQIVLDRIVNELVCKAPGFAHSPRPLKWGMSANGHSIVNALGDKWYC